MTVTSGFSGSPTDTTAYVASPAADMRWLSASPLLLAWLLLYAPIYWQLAGTVWRSEEQGHAPLIGLTVAYFFWQQRRALAAMAEPPSTLSGAMLLACGLLLVISGQALELPSLLMASQVPVLAGVLLIQCGMAGLRLMRFAVLFLAFMVPLPGALIDLLTGQMKEMLSALTVEMLHAFGYPVARSGVVIVVGQYQMLMADACSGLHSLLALAALGTLYSHLLPDRSRGHKAALLLAILPCALAANLLRVLLLVLLTFHEGDAVGRYWHEIMGLLMFLVTLALLIGVDALLHARLTRRPLAGEP